MDSEGTSGIIQADNAFSRAYLPQSSQVFVCIFRREYLKFLSRGVDYLLEVTRSPFLIPIAIVLLVGPLTKSSEPILLLGTLDEMGIGRGTLGLLNDQRHKRKTRINLSTLPLLFNLRSLHILCHVGHIVHR